MHPTGTIIMSRRKGLSHDEKREKMMEIFYDKMDFFQLKVIHLYYLNPHTGSNRKICEIWYIHYDHNIQIVLSNQNVIKTQCLMHEVNIKRL